MNTHDKYELPPLPSRHAVYRDPTPTECGLYREPDCDVFTADQMQDYARAAIEHFLSQSGQYITNDASRQAAIDAAIEADRQRRGEPVAEIVSKHGDPEAFGERGLTLRADIQKLPYGTLLYTGSQPAEPVKVPSDEIVEAVEAYGRAYSMPNTTAAELSIRIHEIRALLARYGQPAQPAASVEPEGCPECEITHARLACAAPVAAQPQPSGISVEFEASLKTAEAFNADIPVTEQEEEEWKRLEDRK